MYYYALFDAVEWADAEVHMCGTLVC